MSAPPGFSGAAYGADQACAVAADGQLVRISIAYKRPPGAGAGSTATSSPTTIGSHQQHPGSSRPLLLRAYGSYGLREAVAFDPATLLALDMGLGVAVAHVRGGGWGGPAWQHAGSGLSKHVAVADLAACARHLVQVGGREPGGALGPAGNKGLALTHAIVASPGRPSTHTRTHRCAS
jgi:protease II